MSVHGSDHGPDLPALMQVDLAKLPIWSGDPKKDGYTCEQWVERVDRARGTAGWTPQQTMSYVYNALRGSALLWYEALPRYGVDDRNWLVVRVELLDAYSRVQTTRTAVIGLSNLNQNNDEPVNDFGARVAKVVNDLDKLMPQAAREPQGVAWPAALTALAGFGAVADDVKQGLLNTAAEKAVWNTMNHMGVQLFISNLKPIYRDELMKTPPATLMEAVKAARHLEKIKQDPKQASSASTVSVVDAEQTDQQIEALSSSFKSWLSKRGNSRGRARGRGNGNNRGYRSGPNGNNGNGGNSTPYNTCRYCKKPGHLQKVCNSRIRAGAPEVDDKGKPYAKYVHEVEQEEEQQQQQQYQEQGSIAANFNPWAYYNSPSNSEPDFC